MILSDFSERKENAWASKSSRSALDSWWEILTSRLRCLRRYSLTISQKIFSDSKRLKK